MKLRQIFKESANHEDIQQYIRQYFRQYFRGADYEISNDGKIIFKSTTTFKELLNIEKEKSDKPFKIEYPIKSVEGNFDINKPKIVSLENFPEIVKGNIRVPTANLKNLKNNYKIKCKEFHISLLPNLSLDLQDCAVEAEEYRFSNCNIKDLKDFLKNNKMSRIQILPSETEFTDSITNYPNRIILYINLAMLKSDFPLLDCVYFNETKGFKFSANTTLRDQPLDKFLENCHGKGNSVVVELTEKLIEAGLEKNARFSF
jgi:hypothetical protein